MKDYNTFLEYEEFGEERHLTEKSRSYNLSKSKEGC